jgi:hypothetical protein
MKRTFPVSNQQNEFIEFVEKRHEFQFNDSLQSASFTQSFKFLQFKLK